MLAAAMRKAAARRPQLVAGPNGTRFGHIIDLRSTSVADENLFYNYDDSEPAMIRFKLSNQHELVLYFPDHGTCHLIADVKGPQIRSPREFRKHFNCPIGFVPILGPVEHLEYFREKETARLALYSYGAARNFRNIWYHFPDQFDLFRSVLMQTWPGMDVQRPELVMRGDGGKPHLAMFCPEERIPREISWAGFGFQVWCQMLTHVIQSSKMALFLIDEPDIYLHSELQRQLLGLLRELGPDILVATHSTEIITEAEADDIVIVDKKRKSARRIRSPNQLEEVFAILGSALNPVLTQLAKTRRALFVEGKDFHLLGLFARKLKFPKIANRSEFAVIPVGGFSPERIRNLKDGIETTLGGKILASAILDGDFRSTDERAAVSESCSSFCRYIAVHKRKEIENFLLVPAALDRAAEQRLADQSRRSGIRKTYAPFADSFLQSYCSKKRSYVAAQYVAFRKQYERARSTGIDDATINECALNEFEAAWDVPSLRFAIVPGKEALSNFNQKLQEGYGISLTPTAIVNAMSTEEIPKEMRDLVEGLSDFSRQTVSSDTSKS